MTTSLSSPRVAAVRAALTERFDGVVLGAGEEGYDARRLGWNRTVDSRPAVIAVATHPEDVRTAVRTAREHDLELAIQATGHGSLVSVDRSLQLCTGSMTGIHIDPQRRVARVAPGARWAEVNWEAARFGLAGLAGRCSTVGVTGYTLGGGQSWLSRTYGFAADSVVRAEVVLADGRSVVAAPEENPDLFWALRGGGGNFGVVTALEFRLYPVPQVYAGMSFYPLERATQTITAYREWVREEPDQMNSGLLLVRLPPHPEIPEELRGRRVLALRAFYHGAAARGRGLLAPLLDEAGPPLQDGFAVRSFPDASAATNGPEAPPMPVRQETEMFHDLSDDVVTAMVDAGAEDSPLAFVELRHWGGAMARPKDDAGPAGGRDARFSVMSVAPYPATTTSTVDRWMNQLAQRLAPTATGSSLLNLLTDPGRTRSAFIPADYARLADVKRAWDPDNFFHLHHNIAPAETGANPTRKAGTK